jgi:hypothetical protein
LVEDLVDLPTLHLIQQPPNRKPDREADRIAITGMGTRRNSTKRMDLTEIRMKPRPQ